MIKAIGFDYGGVIGSHRPVIPSIVKITGLTLDEVKSTYFKHNKLANVGNMTYEQTWEVVLEELNKKNYLPEIIKLLAKNYNPKLDENVISLIDELRIKGFKVGLLSNNTKEIGNRLRAEGLDKHFNVFLISGEIGFQKPDSEAFKIFFRDLNVEPEETIYIDDTEQSLKHADEIGFKPILFQNAKQLRVELVSLGLLKS